MASGQKGRKIQSKLKRAGTKRARRINQSSFQADVDSAVYGAGEKIKAKGLKALAMKAARKHKAKTVIGTPEMQAVLAINEAPWSMEAAAAVSEGILYGEHVPSGNTVHDGENLIDSNPPLSKNGGEVSTKRFNGDDGPILGKPRKTHDEVRAIQKRNALRAPTV